MPEWQNGADIRRAHKAQEKAAAAAQVEAVQPDEKPKPATVPAVDNAKKV